MKTKLTLVLLLTGSLCLGQTTSENFVLSRTYKQTGANANDVGKVTIQVNYLDGHGRPSQTVSVRQSPTGNDIVVPVEYDGYGREEKKYLPYTVSGGNGTYQPAAFTAQGSFYSGNTPGMKSADLARPYTQSILETSPLSRPLGQRAPGDKSATGLISYGSNSANEVKRYDYAAGTVTTSGDYSSGRLFKTQTTDENGKVTIDFTDINQVLICKRVLNGTEELSTYYVYDGLNRLRVVLQPQYQDNASLADFAFIYEYDTRGRMTSKKIPGSGTVLMVYDNYDRPVLTQDANQLSRGVWSFTKYDRMNRPVMTGEIVSNDSQATWQTSFNGSSEHHEDKTTTGIGYTLTNTLPSITEADALKVNYFDDYSFPKASNLGYSNTYSVTALTSAKTHPTGTRTRMLTGTANWLTSVTYYDAEYRPIQTVNQLDNLGTDAIERISRQYKYDLAPVIAAEKTDQILSGTVTHTHIKVFEYDHADRLLSVKETLKTGTVAKEAYTVAQRYNELGQLSQKWLHSEDATKYRRRTNYTYNIRSWMTHAKTWYKTHDYDPDLSFYNLELAYDHGDNLTNGNISHMQWSGKDEADFSKGLSFSYDGANRLTSSTGLSGYGDAESGITFDKNGNIKTLVRAGNVVDNLTYTYSGNRLSGVNDASGNSSGIKSGSSSYEYDGNGNMTSDGNRSATLSYNYLNLPKTVVINSKTLTYDYDAAGTKHQYITDTLTIKYANDFQYNASNNFSRLALTEGQAIFRNDTLRFDYYLKDHLGNVRVVFDEKGQILQQTDYYPFGLEIDRNDPAQTSAVRNGVNRYLYNEKELQVGSGYVDYGARMYMPEIGRWGVVDPLVEKGRRWSPYSYALGSPMRFIDPDGMWPWSFNIRSFAPFREFGGWFKGDNRGYSTASNASARLSHSFTVDPSKQSYSNQGASSSPSSHPVFGTATARDDRGNISNFTSTSNKDGSNTASFTSSMAAHNPLVPGSPDINVKTDFTLTENVKAGTLDVSAVQTGDAFPATETLIGDTKDNQLFIGVSPANAGTTGPFTQLPGDNNDRAMMSASFTVTLDSQGRFTGVKQGDTTYTVAEWNNMNRQKPTSQP